MCVCVCVCVLVSLFVFPSEIHKTVFDFFSALFYFIFPSRDLWNSLVHTDLLLLSSEACELQVVFIICEFSVIRMFRTRSILYIHDQQMINRLSC